MLEFNELEFIKMIDEWKKESPVQYEIRPWGIFAKFNLMFKEVTVKEITVKPGKRLSLQKHLHRDEFWFALSPNMTVYMVAPNGSESTRYPAPITDAALTKIFIPRNWWHRLTNAGKETGHILEISLGEFDENDIIRSEDDFGRI